MNNNTQKQIQPEIKIKDEDAKKDDSSEGSGLDEAMADDKICGAASAANPDVVLVKSQADVNRELKDKEIIDQPDENNSEGNRNEIVMKIECVVTESQDDKEEEDKIIETSSDEENKVRNIESNENEASIISTSEIIYSKNRDRKLSLDHTILSRGEGFSQSELNLNTVGKLPLERKSSFFRKKMDSFLKNTTEIFKRQSKTVQRTGSMSGSLQSLNEKTGGSNYDFNNHLKYKQEMLENSSMSLNAVPSITRSVSSLSMFPNRQTQQASQQSLSGSQPVLNAVSSSTLENNHSNSVHSLNESFLREAMLKSRAISMSSGLDAPMGQQRRKASRSNRVTWVASEGLTNYFRRIIQDEKTTEMKGCQSYQDFSCIPENESYDKKTDSKGRRLSYQRAVSGEDPVMPSSRYQDSSMRRRNPIPENSETYYELSNHLAEFSRNGIPSLQGFELADIPDMSFAYLLWAQNLSNIEDWFDWRSLPSMEDARQAVIRELIHTEADYVKHLIAIVEVFIATAHSLQDSGKMLNVDTEKMFSNIPDLLNASLVFWNVTFMPMILDAVENSRPFNSDLMASGFCRFREIFQPYEKFVTEQTKITEYLKVISNDPEFSLYLSWCYRHKACNRLQLSDFIVKPMQRLTKYSMILRRVIVHTDTEPERTALMAMERFAKNYVIDLNRTIRQREELGKLDEVSNSIEAYEVDFKDEDMDKYYKMYAQLNLKAPMVNCIATHSRSVIFQGDMRFKDNVKEIEVRVFLLTDMLLICKKLSKGSSHPYKLIRPKFMIDKMLQFPRYVTKTSKDLSGLVYVMVDEVGSSYTSFILSETAKDPTPAQTLKTWENKVKEAKLTYDLSVWFARNPSRDVSELDIDSSAEYALSKSRSHISDDSNIEYEARERVAAMLHRSMGASTDYDCSQASLTTDSFDGLSSGRPPGIHSLRHYMHRTSTASSRNSRLSSFQHSTSAASHDEPQPGPSKMMHKAASSFEHLMPQTLKTLASITVNVVGSESESAEPETAVPAKDSDRSSPSTSNTLRVQPQNNVVTLVHSLPDLTIEPSTPRSTSSPPAPSASEKMYQSHQELLQRNRLVAAQQHQYLTPDHRGSSYPPPSPTRASLKRGLAFSYSFKNPPLAKMGHVNSQSQAQPEAGTSGKEGKSDRSTSPKPSTSSDKGDKKSTKPVSSSSFFSSGGWHSKLEG